MKNKKPKVSIIIPNWNGKKYLKTCLDSVFRTNYKNYEIIFVDNASTDSSVAFVKKRYASKLKSKKIKLILNNKNYGFAKGCNIGIRYALQNDAKYILLLNNDVVVKEDFISSLIKQAEKYRKYRKVGAISPKIYFYNSNKIWSTYGYIDWRYEAKLVGYGEIDRRQYDMPIFNTIITGCSMLITKTAIERVGLLDESYFAYFEDTDWCIRAKKAKFDVIYVPYPQVWHRGGATSKKEGRMSPRHRYLGTRNKLVTIRKNFGKMRFIDAFLRELLIITPIYIILYIYRKHFDLILAQIQGIIDALRNKNKYLQF